MQCLRRLFEEKNAEQGYNGIKYFLTIVAVCLRTAYSVDKDNQFVWRMLAGIFSAIAAIFCTYWDLVLDWGLLNRTSKNRWLRDKLLIPQKKVYFIAMVRALISPHLDRSKLIFLVLKKENCADLERLA